MIIKRRSILTGEHHTRDIPVTPEQLVMWHAGMHIQDAMPNIPPHEREFLMTGITKEEWDEEFKDGDPDEDEHDVEELD